jgi:hypothetical protein
MQTEYSSRTTRTVFQAVEAVTGHIIAGSCRMFLILLLCASLATLLHGQETLPEDPGAVLPLQLQAEQSRFHAHAPGNFSQELDSFIRAQASVVSNPLYRSAPIDEFPERVTSAARRLFEWESLKLGLTYTLLNQYAVNTPTGVRHNQASGRFDLTAAVLFYENGSTAGSFSLLVRGGTNIGISQQFNLSDALGSTTLINWPLRLWGTATRFGSSSSWVAITWSAPRSSNSRFFAEVLVVAMEIAPRAFTICMAASPTEELAAVSRTVSPGPTLAKANRAPYAVAYCIQAAAPSTDDSDGGSSATSSAGTTALSPSTGYRFME